MMAYAIIVQSLIQELALVFYMSFTRYHCNTNESCRVEDLNLSIKIMAVSTRVQF